MSKNSVEDAKVIMQALLQKKLQYMGRSCELVDFGFGDIVKDKTLSGKELVRASYTLHLQCPFRVSVSNKIITGSDDLFISPFDGNDFVDLNLQHTCLFDYQVEKFRKAHPSEYVQKISLNTFGDVCIEMTTAVISIFVTNSSQDESWRFFQTVKKKNHLVYEGGGFELY
ncbi:MAG: hypothetical protein GX051_10790 [Clostridiales bacterium]|nr:hypothetical protein [Clostridiales bacterium]